MMIALAAMVMELKNVISVMVKVSISMAMNVLHAMEEDWNNVFLAVAEEKKNVHFAAAEEQNNVRHAMVEDIGYVMIVTDMAKQNVKNAMAKACWSKCAKSVTEMENINY